MNEDVKSKISSEMHSWFPKEKEEHISKQSYNDLLFTKQCSDIETLDNIDIRDLACKKKVSNEVKLSGDELKLSGIDEFVVRDLIAKLKVYHRETLETINSLEKLLKDSGFEL